MGSKGGMLITAAVLLVIAFFTAQAGFIRVDLGAVTMNELGAEFLSLIFVALVVERAVEVFVNSEFDGRENSSRRPVRLARLAVQNAQVSLDAEVGRALPERQDPDAAQTDREEKAARVRTAETRLRDLENQLRLEEERLKPVLDALGEEKKRFATRLALGLGLAASVVGIRVLSQFVPTDEVTGLTDIPSGVPLAQITAFRIFDIIVTGLLLAGGAQGIHNLLGDFLDKKNVLDRPN